MRSVGDVVCFVCRALCAILGDVTTCLCLLQ